MVSCFLKRWKSTKRDATIVKVAGCVIDQIPLIFFKKAVLIWFRIFFRKL